ncbi:hypothetical protein [Bordetella petrii]|uniref:hypothetical protein n=1 Tax=Bordetella petrii TaxID=94624 RepID=UPI00047C2E0C|nr:hypothetical protein [Bordetella petrii]
MNAQATPQPVLYEHFLPGALLGEHTEVYSDAQSRRWQSIFGQAGPDGGAEPASMAVVMMMRAYLNIVTPRPPGNIHARQQLHMQGLPRPGEAVRLGVRCLDKSLRRERRYVDLQVDGHGEDGRPLFRGVLTLIWAA